MHPKPLPFRALLTRTLALTAVAGLLLGHTANADAATTRPAPTAAARTHSAATCSSTPFRSDPARHVWFRIPAVVKTTAGTLVAFAEKRDNSDGSDMGNYDVVATRSTDSGCTWSAYRTIGDDAGNKVGSPAPVVDTSTGDILLISQIQVLPDSGGRGKGLYLQTSSDDGQTFTPLLSHPIRASGNFKGGSPDEPIQLQVTHPGRIVVPLAYRTSAGVYGAYGIYSDDHGASWRTGYAEQDQTGAADYIEGTVAELPTGKLFISYRLRHDQAKAGTARQYAYSTDGGATLSQPFGTLPLKIVSVQGSALAVAGPQSGELLFSAPSDPTANLRRDMAVFVSTTDGASWTHTYQVELESYPAAYSNLVQLDSQTVGLLYETGTTNWKARIAWQTISIPSLTNPQLVPSHLTSRRSGSPTPTSARARVKAMVKVDGISSPPGRVTLTATGPGGTRSASLGLTHANSGVKWLTLPKLSQGAYRLTLTYAGTDRIKPATISAGVLHVVRP